ncbi:MAG: hypothetical protein NC823_02395, partial [Candidatus Omnitrophica bacterium]|nr:hypothetical protein [Candidatus Omnitrophota bacterium]
MGVLFRTTLAIFFLGWLVALASEEAIQYTADSLSVRFTGQGELQGIELEGNVRILYQNLVLSCEKAFLDRIGGTIQAEGQIKVETEMGSFQADSLVYDLGTSSGLLTGVRFAAEPFYGQANLLSRKEGIFLMEKGYVTTCDLARPHYRLVSDRIEFKPGSYLKTGPTRVVLGEKLTVFYLPGWTYNLKAKKSPVEITPGYRSGVGQFLGIAFNQSLKKDTDLIFSERVYIQSKGLAGGLEFSSAERKWQVETMAVKKWQESEPDYGGTAGFQYNFSGKWGKIGLWLDWRWMKDNDFFYDYFQESFFEKSGRYNYLVLTRPTGPGWLSFQTRERAREQILSAEQLPAVRFLLSRLPLGQSPFYLSNDFQIGHWIIEGKESVRTINCVTLEAKRNIGFFGLNPWVSLSALNYFDSEGEIFRHPLETGISFSTYLTRNFRDRYQEQLIPSLILVNRSLLSPEPSLPVYDQYELLSSGSFAGVKLDWHLWRGENWLGEAGLVTWVDLGREKFSDSLLHYQIHPAKKLSFSGTNIWS